VDKILKGAKPGVLLAITTYEGVLAIDAIPSSNLSDTSDLPSKGIENAVLRWSSLGFVVAVVVFLAYLLLRHWKILT
jgi:hypothetical protein